MSVVNVPAFTVWLNVEFGAALTFNETAAANTSTPNGNPILLMNFI
jgi:hypothetical protein